MTELASFIVARIDEDEDRLRRMQRKIPRPALIAKDPDGMGSVSRLRAECTAKRNIVGQTQQLLVLRDLPSERVVRDSAAQMLRALAAPYCDHYAYRAEWAPARH